MSKKDKQELLTLATQVYNKILAMQAECKAMRIASEAILNK